MTDESLRSFDSNYKVDPPLRTQAHIDALLAGLVDGTIDAISSDHQPYAAEKKSRELDVVPFGIVGLETLLPICVQTLIEPEHLDWPALIEKLTAGPARILGINKGTLAADADADITLIDPAAEWTIDPGRFRSKGRNTPFAGRAVRGRIQTVLVNGEVRYRCDD